ncbi:MAG: efflux RND transporter periplasmic adaptor subunit, partial [Methylotenera sp.]
QLNTKLCLKKLRLVMEHRKMWAATSLITLVICFISFKLIAKTNEPVKTSSAHEQIIVHESDLNTVYLSDDAYRKLGIQVASVKRETTTESKTYGGEIVVPAGGKVSVSAPITGKLISINPNALIPGAQVRAGQLLYRVQPIITADARANLVNALTDAESLVNTAKSQVDAADISLQRAKKLLDDLVGSQRNEDEANANHHIALRNLEAANAKKAALHQVVNLGTVESIQIKAPQSGIISNVFAVPDQLVSVGSPVIEISELNTLWIRVPVPVGDLNAIDQRKDATVTPLSSVANADARLLAKPVNAPPSADPLTSSAHLYYAIQNSQSTLRPAQRVSITLNTIGKSSKDLTIPWSAIVFDIHGGSWVYIQKSKNIYERNRVFLDHVTGSNAVMSQGPAEGSHIVVNGALELFGVETGFSH